ncbi:MAG: HAMP domain-containing histidine kinase [Defluviitaleaceae bacterium]|nr:HAMP domain-containing histidine kinase [Defluviitaleaceae bacterium]MCL2273697.1 HAMP domain-containing histidine kinase [Defluviitaleaceae bacterium]
MPLVEAPNIDLVTALAHEIKNPAALALAHVNLLRGGEKDITKSCDHIQNALETIVDLTHDMLHVTYGQPLAYDFDVHLLIVEVMQQFESAHRGVQFTLHPQLSTLTLRAPEINLRLILTNLIKNAVEAAIANPHAPPEVTLFYGIKDEWLYIVVRDSGTEEKQKPAGNGLGLPIVKHLLERMGGEITLRTGLLGGCEAVARLRTFL